MTSHQFGGNWTDNKLERLRKYLHAYITIFKGNQWARKYQTTFVDAFAGTGYRQDIRATKITRLPLFLEDTPIYDEEVTSFQKGSAQIALETSPPFDRYLFIERNPEYVAELRHLREQYPAIAQRIDIIQGEANLTIREWCQSTDWAVNRVVVFLDPYGMEVEWATIESLARTRAVDLFILFPLGQAINRVLIRNQPPEGGWADRLTTFFGTPGWKEAFYKRETQMTLFGEEEFIRKEANFEQIGAFFLQRLAAIFARVADNPLYLRNSKNVPIYLLCFASANKRGASTAVKIAQDILGK